ncbi:MAG TPA: isoleucine--tRNA ligase [Pyrinomonadaceae bacterium]|jgi:isoleucyl-tRNA synthetase|nr:isoleucine--tRNA ligase [Pyrinomonadaceae bacterium]
MSTETPLDLKKTVNLPKTNFAQKANLAQSEPARLKKWTAAGLYGMIRNARAGAEKFILHDGPPYANADIHLGTALNKILKDFIIKTRTMMGYDAPYVPGYDCHGLPIELYVDKKLGAKKANMPPLSIRRACREHATQALKSQTRDFQRLGILGEWNGPYLTMSNTYEAETARLFGRFIERGYVYKGARPVYWCIHDQTALAEAEVEYREHTSPSVYVKFELINDPEEIHKDLAGRKVFFLIWTTTPWTLPANLGIAVNPDFEYACLENGDETYIVAKDLVGPVADKCGIGLNPREQGQSGMMVRDLMTLPHIMGAKLEGLKCRHPWIEDKESLVMLGEHVTLGGESDAETELDVSEARDKRATGKGAGTGCVHTAPGHGHDDFVIGKRYGLEIYCPVDNAGRFTSEVEHFAGERVFDANQQIVEFMRERGVLVFTENYAHRYPHCWRCKNPVIFRATPQWFISMDRTLPAERSEQDEDGRAITNYTENFEEGRGGDSLRAGALREIECVKWIPSWGVDRMRNMLKGRPDWCVSRQRVWGVPIPVFYCAGCEEAVADSAIVNHVADIFERDSADAWYERPASELLPEGYKCSQCGGTEWTKETDILDVWFDSGVSSIAVLEHRENLRWPADVYLEGGDQYRGWFNSSLMVGLATHDAAPYKAVLTHGWMLDGQGKAMHKSAGNAIAPDEVMKDSGAEILRLWTSSIEFTEDMRCSPEILQRISDAYRKIRNTARFALGNLHGFDPARDVVSFEEMLEIDRWVLAELNAVIEKVTVGYENYEFHTAYQTLYNFCTVTLSARYMDIIKDTLYTALPRSHARRSAQTALYRIVDALARMLAPILVFTADEIWENLPEIRSKGRLASVHLGRLPEASEVGDAAELLSNWSRLFDIREEVLRRLEEYRAAKKIGSSLDARVNILAHGERFEFLQRYHNQLRYIFIVSQVDLEYLDKPHNLDDPQFNPPLDLMIPNVYQAYGQKCERCWNYSTRVGESTRYPTACERCLPVLLKLERGEVE